MVSLSNHALSTVPAVKHFFARPKPPQQPISPQPDMTSHRYAVSRIPAYGTIRSASSRSSRPFSRSRRRTRSCSRRSDRSPSACSPPSASRVCAASPSTSTVSRNVSVPGGSFDEPRGEALAREVRRAAERVADPDVAEPIDRRARHPSIERVGRVRALLVQA